MKKIIIALCVIAVAGAGIYTLTQPTQENVIVTEEPAVEEILEPAEEPIEDEPVIEEEPIIEEEPVIAEEPVVEEEPVIAEEPIIEEEPKPTVTPKPTVASETTTSTSTTSDSTTSSGSGGSVSVWDMLAQNDPNGYHSSGLSYGTTPLK